MLRSSRLFVRRACIVAAAVWIVLPATAWSWGAQTHHYIAQNYSKHLPPTIDGLRAYDSVVDAHVTDPDTRKSSTPGEAPRHFIDIDTYPEFAAGTLSHDRATLEAKYGVTTVTDTGILPWAVGEVVTTLTAQFQAGQWSAAALTIADLCHYVGDSSQPLHCTQNYDGQSSGNSGIHSRYETTMINSHIAELSTPAMGVTYYANPVDAMFDFITTSQGDVAAVLAGDVAGKAAAGGSTSSTAYYTALWNSVQAMTRAQINSGAIETASFVYTAWMNAGQPFVPGSTANVVPGAVAGVHLEAGPTPFSGAVTVRFSGTGPLSVDVYDVRGARVGHLIDHASGAGSVSWRPASGTAAGLYFVRLAGPQGNIVRRVTFLD